jgi:hypothetical protein
VTHPLWPWPDTTDWGSNLWPNHATNSQPSLGDSVPPEKVHYPAGFASPLEIKQRSQRTP